MRRSLVTCAVLACTLLGAPGSASARHADPRVTTDCADTAHRPRAMQTCGIDVIESFRKLRWSRWGDHVALGRGRWTPGCQAFVGNHCPGERTTSLRLSRPTSCGAFRVFTRLRVRGGKLTSVIDLDCPVVHPPPGEAQTAQLPACGGAPPATLGGVPRRLRYGNAAHPHIALQPGGALTRATIQVGAKAPMTVVENGAPLPVPRTSVYQRFDAPPLRVRLVTEEPGPCRRVQDRTIHGVRHITAAQGCLDSGYRPRRIFTCEVINGLSADRLSWRRWNHDVARGRGRWKASCPPIPGARCAAPIASRFAASRIRYCAQYGSYVYTRLRVTPAAGGPPHTVGLSCPQVATEGE
jgi:hypothetical protein